MVKKTNTEKLEDYLKEYGFDMPAKTLIGITNAVIEYNLDTMKKNEPHAINEISAWESVIPYLIDIDFYNE